MRAHDRHTLEQGSRNPRDWGGKWLDSFVAVVRGLRLGASTLPPGSAGWRPPCMLFRDGLEER